MIKITRKPVVQSIALTHDNDNVLESRIMPGDCLVSMAKLPENSVDLLVSDPPYGLKFMGKSWDDAVPSVGIWKAALRVLKPGAFAMIMCAPRQDCLAQMIVRIGEAGFDTEFTSIYWTYACLSADTEVLTPAGWKNHAQLRQSNFTDKLVVYDRASDSFNTEQASHWNEYAVSEDLYRIKSEKSDQLVSRNHRVLTPSGFVLAENLPQHCEVVCVPRLPDDLWHLSSGSAQEAGDGGNVLLNKLPSEGTYAGASSGEAAREPVFGGKEAVAARGHDGIKELGLEGWRDSLQEEGQLQEREVRALPTGVTSDGPEGRVRHGAPSICSARDRTHADESGDCASRGPQSDEQLAIEFDAVRDEQGSQTIRAWAPSHAVVERYAYSGTIYCPTVSTGCFLARRNGKMFLTGNSGFPKAGNIGKLVDKRLGATREVVGRRTDRAATPKQDIRGGNLMAGENGAFDGSAITAASSPEAKALDGSYAGFQPKPAVEIIIIAMKPLSSSTFVGQAMSRIEQENSVLEEIRVLASKQAGEVVSWA